MRLINLPLGIVIGWMFARGLVSGAVITGMIAFAATVLEPTILSSEPVQDFSEESSLHVRE